jgi:hypothetical protein
VYYLQGRGYACLAGISWSQLSIEGTEGVLVIDLAFV